MNVNINIQSFGLGEAITETSVEKLGGKGAGLVWMTQQGLPVPPGFTITTDAWESYLQKPVATLASIQSAIAKYLHALREFFGYTPLLSVRSGSRVSCPGMMDTILNVGIDPVTETFWSGKLGGDAFVDSYARLVTMYGSVVKGIDRKTLENGGLVAYHAATGESFPDTAGQLLGSIEAVFKSWDNERATTYRKLNGIPYHYGTAVTVQAMVFGNLNEESGSGVLFTRNCTTGENIVTGEYLANAQGEDVVAGIRTPKPLATDLPFYAGLVEVSKKLEVAKADVQDVEFTVQDGKVFFLQIRTAKREAVAAIKIALDLVAEGLITPRAAISRVTAKQFDLANQSIIDPAFKKAPKFTGIAASSGVVTGKPVFSAKAAVESKVPCILVVTETTPDDIAGMAAAQGTITMHGGLTSHAAVVARGMNWPCITGVGATAADFKKAAVVSFDGATGRIWFEAVQTVSGKSLGLTAQFRKLIEETLNITPVINDVPADHKKQALAYFGAGIFDTATVAVKVAKILQKVDKLYLDLTPVEQKPFESFTAIFGGHDAAGLLVAALDNLLAPADKKRLKIVGVATSKFETVAYGKDITALVLAESEILCDLDVNDPAIAKVLAWRSKDGLECIALGRKIENGKSFVSLEQALHLATA